MDSVSQFVLGATVAGVCAPKEHKGKALLIGGALGTLPDLDVLVDFGDPVSNFVLHRGFSHSLFVLVPFSLVLWLALHRWWSPVREAPARWLAVIMLTLVTHVLLDAHTVYGTQIWWPLDRSPEMWSTLFIIDPLYTVPLVVGVIAAAFLRDPVRRHRAVSAGLIISTLYLGWSWTSKLIVEHHSIAALKPMQLQDAPRFSVPTPFNTLLWRVVVKIPDGYLVGYRSVIADSAPMQFTRYASDDSALGAASEIEAVAQLRWFARDFLQTEVKQGAIVISDIRMGLEPDSYVFSFETARQNSPTWVAIEPKRVESIRDFGRLSDIWDRIWNENHNSYATGPGDTTATTTANQGKPSEFHIDCEKNCTRVIPANERFNYRDTLKSYVF